MGQCSAIQTKSLKIACFVHDAVGLQALKFLVKNYPEDINCILVSKDSSLFLDVLQLGVPKENIYGDVKLESPDMIEALRSMNLDYVFLMWWPFIIPEKYLGLAKKGFVNFHPSYLPYNRGKHYNFWNIIEDVPFGVSLHFAEKDVDAGCILAQRRITTSWLDTGASLYDKARREIVALFEETYPLIREDKIKPQEQKIGDGTFHYGHEMDAMCRLDLSKKYNTRDLLNLIRARTFEAFPGCAYVHQGAVHEVRLEIYEITDGEFGQYQALDLDKGCTAFELLQIENDIDGRVSKVYVFKDKRLSYKVQFNISFKK